MTSTPAVTLDDIEPGITALTIRSPSTKNALTAGMAREIVVACDVLDARTDVAVTILRGGGSYFCSGAHRDLLREAASEGPASRTYEQLESVYRAFLRVGRLQPITIAAVVGGAVGAGVNLMLAADLRIVDRDARIVGGFTRLAIHPGGGHFVLTNRSGGREFAAAMGLLGLEVTGSKCEQLGVAWEAVDASEVESTAIALGRAVARDPTLARLVKETFAMEVDLAQGPWGLAVRAEQAAQMWSLRRSLD